MAGAMNGSASPVRGGPRAAVSAAGLRPGSFAAGLRAPVARGSLCPSISDPMAAAMPPPPPRPPMKVTKAGHGGKGSTRGGKGMAATTAVCGGKGAATTAAHGGEGGGDNRGAGCEVNDGGARWQWCRGDAWRQGFVGARCCAPDACCFGVRSGSDGVPALVAEDEEEQTEDDIKDEEVVEIQKSGWKRGGNYSVSKDEALVSAWENVTTDPVTGKDQPGASYWQRISDYYHRNVKVLSCWTHGSLSHRWKSIAECCTRWSGCVENVDRQQPSGMTIEDRQNVTQELYKQREPNGRGFAMLHCWQMLKHNEKDKDPHPLKKRGSSDMEFDDYGDDDDESGRSTTPSSDWPANKRPPGRKISKERMKSGGGEGDVFQSAVQDIIVTKKELEASRKEDKHAKMEADNQCREYIKSVEERKMAIEQERLRVQEEEAIARKEEASARKEEAIAKKMKQEMKIMFMDISGLDDQQKAWVLATRGDMARKAQKASSESDNGNDGSGRREETRRDIGRQLLGDCRSCTSQYPENPIGSLPIE
ncbi:hypothetical protein EJB05_15787, partial [Eragrostis curvula]